MNNFYKNWVLGLLAETDIRINGTNAWDFHVHDETIFRDIYFKGSLGLGKGYTAGKWDCDDKVTLFEKILEAELDEKAKYNFANIASAASAFLFNQQTILRSRFVGKKHYDVGNDLYQRMLGSSMLYTCAYWDNGAKTLDEAQAAKMDLICRKLGLPPKGTGPKKRMLDIGCGFSGAGKYITENYDIEYTGITISKEQIRFGKEFCSGLPVTIRDQDYRKIKNERYDYIISLGMFEHVGRKNYRKFMKIVHNCLTDDGLALLHTIGGNTSVSSTDPWIADEIFPNSMLPSHAQIGKACEGLFVIEDVHNMSFNYKLTLKAWRENFVRHWPEIAANYPDPFFRKWDYYLQICEASFGVRVNQLWQIVLSKKGVRGGYKSVR